MKMAGEVGEMFSPKETVCLKAGEGVEEEKGGRSFISNGGI